jgi:hypothetical protein
MSGFVETPQTTKGRPRLVTPDQFRYNFPPSPRRLGGTLSVEEATHRLTKLFSFHRMLMRTLAGWIIQIPEFEVKVEIAHHLYMHAEAARSIRGRLIELRVSPASFDSHEDKKALLVGSEIEHSHNAAELIAAIHCVVAKHLLDAARQYERLTDGLADLPTVRVLRRIALDLEEICSWGETAVRAYTKGGLDEEALALWRGHIESLLLHVSGVMGDRESGERPQLRQEKEPQFRRQIGCARDDRFILFHHTRDYSKADPLAASEQGDYEGKRLELIRVQRDEIDAIETFANVLYDLPSPPFDLQMDLARFIWDEARHAEIGHQSLSRLGFDPYDVPCGVIGINVRSPLPPELALAQISVFGELNIVGPMRRLSQSAYQRGDRDTGITFDFIHADELIHLRRGRAWLKAISPNKDLASLEREAKEVAIKRLLEEGVIGEDYAMNLTPSEIGELIGE